MASHDEPTTSSDGEVPTLDVPGAEDGAGAAPKAAPRRRRATKKAAAPAVSTDDTGADAGDLHCRPSLAGVGSPARFLRRPPTHSGRKSLGLRPWSRSAAASTLGWPISSSA